MKHIAKTMSRFLLLGLTAGCGFFATINNNRTYAPAFADGEQAASKTYTEADFIGEEQTSSGEIVLSIYESTTTDTSQFLNISYKSVTQEGYQSSRTNYIVSITDPNYTGDASNPAPEGYENIDPETQLPIFEGAISFVTGGSNKEVCLPSTITNDGVFIIKVTTILSHCVSADGDEYHNKNCWYDEYGNLRITGIYIPDTIEVVESHAFMGVPAEGVKIAYEGDALHEGFADEWTDAATITYGEYKTKSLKNAGVGRKVDDMSPAPNFIVGCKQDATHVGEEFDRPLVIEYDKYTNGVKNTVFEALPIVATNGNPYDAVGEIYKKTDSRSFSFKLGPGEYIDEHSVVLHNIMKADDDALIDTSQTYFAKPVVKCERVDISKLISFKASVNSTFAGFSIFSLTMDKNLDIISDKYPEPHSLYLDVKTDLYEQNKNQINKGSTVIHYSLNNLYLSSYHFIYEGRGGALKEAYVPIVTNVTYLDLSKAKNNKVSIIVENKKVAPDFSPEKVRTFELTNITIQMDLYSTNDAGSSSVLGKSDISYKFAYITVRNDEKLSVFNWNIFIIIFVVAFMALYAAIAFVLYKVFKEKFKNDEFRRINDKKFLKKAILYGLGFTVIAIAILFIVMRATGFANTIVAFNPTDPLLIVFAIAGIIIGGYFIVNLVKAIKVEKERRKAVRLKLNEDVEDDGTN